MNKKIVWFARGGGIVRAGPYKSQVEATKALIMVNSPDGSPRFPLDAFVWPEEVAMKNMFAKKKFRCVNCGTLKRCSTKQCTGRCDVCLNCDWERDN